ncbi:hypothetical protein L227DRAFT_561598 [Lentinus tigrinus ALCF2SS1-6]|uniref:Uncharacterized protein n=1 Tax=Lentinus tigrinus ALCF2SS1-6 TaxID=1328759 RepID=A0A5C2SJQ7_9APHY|nr:hypothetical protein L227DRAFT_561598 [Lentinus tigrinus ALCF2SS1-6]
MATRNLTFRSTNLGDNVTLMLCFTPPVPGLYRDQFPIAWKVTTLAARGRSSLNATWTSTLGFSATQVGEGSLVTAGNYTPIKAGQTTTLLLDQTANPPVQHWTDPKDRSGVTSVQAVNRTGGPAGIGIGFITNLDEPTEDINLALTWPNVGNTLAVTGDFTPVLSAYIALDYQETQMVRGDIQSVDPIWKVNLLSLKPSTTIVISKDPTGAYIAKQLNSMEAEAEDVKVPDAIPVSIGSENVTRMYRATLSFAAQSLVSNSLKTIAEHLHSKGYRVKVTLLGKATDALIELVLPTSTSCNQAEKEVLGCIEDHGFPTHIAIKERSGELLAYSKDRFSCWEDINPATNGWYIRKNIVPYITGPGPVKGGALGEIINGVGEVTAANGEATNGNGTATGSAGLLNNELVQPEPQAPVSYAKTRTIGRKASNMFLQA